MNNKGEQLKTILLSLLVVLCIIQTAFLWLGNVSSHNFLEQNTKQEPIMPENVWFIKTGDSNAGVASTMAYHLDEVLGNEKREYERLVTEVTKMISKFPEDKAFRRMEEISWPSILSVSGILYEYPVPVKIVEAIGEFPSEIGDEMIDSIYIYSHTKFQKEATIYLMNTEQNYFYEIPTEGHFKDLQQVYSAIMQDEVTSQLTTYQPSAAIPTLQIKGNTFLPTSSEDVLVSYDVLKAYNPVKQEGEVDLVKLEKYVNSFFVNPLIKESQRQPDGSIEFKEKGKALVIYKPSGVLEYINLAPKQTQTKNTRLSAYHMALDFVKNSESIPNNLVRHLSLSKIVTRGADQVFYFDAQFNGYPIEPTSQLKAKLGIESLVKVIVRGEDIVGATICLVEIEPSLDVSVGGKMVKRDFESHYLEPIDKMLALLYEEEVTDTWLDDVRLIYPIDKLEDELDIEWGVHYQHQWYYP